MNRTDTSGEAGAAQIAGFCDRYGIDRIAFTLTQGITAAHLMCDVTLTFAAAGQEHSYHANFRLHGADARIGERIAALNANGTMERAPGCGEDSPPHRIIADFLQRIEKRVAKIKQEQSVQTIRFLGNRFLLNGTTAFSVISDDQGLLGIEIVSGDQPRQAQMMAGNLLDGLYDGSITLLPDGEI